MMIEILQLSLIKTNEVKLAMSLFYGIYTDCY